MSTFEQPGLPFPLPLDADVWPNKLGFDWRGLEFWTDAGGVRDPDSLTYGVGSNWVAALHDLTHDPKECDP